MKRLSDKELLSAVARKATSMSVPQRRRFLQAGMIVAGTAAGIAQTPRTVADTLQVKAWSKQLGRGVVSAPYGSPSRHEAHVVRRNVPWLTADTVSSISFTPLHELHGIITPNGLVFERYHAGVPEIPPEQHQLLIHGLVTRPLVLEMNDLMRFPSVSVIHFLECPANGGMEWRGAQMEALQFTHGMISCCEWTGVPLSVVLQEAGLKPEGKWILAEGADGAGMTRSIPIEKALDDALLAYAQNGERLRPEQGYPLRLLNPGWEGNTSVKWLRRLKVGELPWHHREETSKYTDLMPDGRSRRFTWVQDANSVILSPCPEKPWTGMIGRFHEIRGIAWSGRGRIKRVDVSDDGGVNWRPAQLKGPVLSKALTRFVLPYEWDGSPKLLQSRAVDETGYVQPTLAQLRDIRGVESIYHKNSIHTWALSNDGAVRNVQIS
ncbi:sulfite dehydrogenase [Candidatus Persebacteraceae bacterium Df01]|jgi:sulfane dehydrogenase subunit SoxC|uniref:Sulfite dehydrogenase n=1 Tax=Candidatus Doriopsillibacter californiensis TaxID=2970740 RepID=A0ABT7QLN8_9GAMM|nr:sulfite dehydrogenase [Candidatus Persebacteraceae bacterium Df01]